MCRLLGTEQLTLMVVLVVQGAGGCSGTVLHLQDNRLPCFGVVCLHDCCIDRLVDDESVGKPCGDPWVGTILLTKC
jgi:hypothetical protein